MLKIATVVSLILIATWSQAYSRRQKKEATLTGATEPGQFTGTVELDLGSAWGASLSCDSCGSECASACGTRHFRACCFNYLRKKRVSENVKLWTPNLRDMKPEKSQKSKLPNIVYEAAPEPWMANLLSNEIESYPFEDTVENRLQILYDV